MSVRNQSHGLKNRGQSPSPVFRLWRWSVIVGLLLTACATTPLPPPTPTPFPTPTATVTPAPTPTLTPTMTPTPLPPLRVEVRLPKVVLALPPVHIAADVFKPPGLQPSVIITAEVWRPDMTLVTTYMLLQQTSERYVSTTPLELPLEPEAGNWLLMLYIRSELNVVGQRAQVFQPVAPPYRELSGTLPSNVTLRVPQAFVEVAAQGDAWAGSYAWHACPADTRIACTGQGAVSLWWVPGPAEPLQLQAALALLDATHDPDHPPAILTTEESSWQGYAAYRFIEEWPGYHGGPAEAWVIQDDAHWLYVLRTRAIGEDDVPRLVQEVGATFALGGE